MRNKIIFSRMLVGGCFSDLSQRFCDIRKRYVCLIDIYFERNHKLNDIRKKRNSKHFFFLKDFKFHRLFLRIFVDYVCIQGCSRFLGIQFIFLKTVNVFKFRFYFTSFFFNESVSGNTNNNLPLIIQKV